MNIGKARALFEQVASREYHGSTVGEYLEAVKIILDIETHNSISKKMIISVCKWLVEIAEQPTIQPEERTEKRTETHSCDLVSRQAALEKVRTMQTYKLFVGDDMILIDKADVQTELMMLPSVQPERKKGKWLPDNNSVCEMRFICSECKESEVVPTIGFTKYKPIWDFCPNCGADMRG